MTRIDTSVTGTIGQPLETRTNTGGRDFAANLNGSKSETAGYLRLQMQMAAESRFFQTVSNILKNRHESAMSAIRNIK